MAYVWIPPFVRTTRVGVRRAKPLARTRAFGRGSLFSLFHPALTFTRPVCMVQRTDRSVCPEIRTLEEATVSATQNLHPCPVGPKSRPAELAPLARVAFYSRPRFLAPAFWLDLSATETPLYVARLPKPSWVLGQRCWTVAVSATLYAIALLGALLVGGDPVIAIGRAGLSYWPPTATQALGDGGVRERRRLTDLLSGASSRGCRGAALVPRSARRVQTSTRTRVASPALGAPLLRHRVWWRYWPA